MHYIVGTSFLVEPPSANRTTLPSRYDRLFTVGLYYRLTNIIKSEDQYEYYFVDSNGNKQAVIFPNCREADKFIAKLKKENIPDYESRMSQEVDY